MKFSYLATSDEHLELLLNLELNLSDRLYFLVEEGATEGAAEGDTQAHDEDDLGINRSILFC